MHSLLTGNQWIDAAIIVGFFGGAIGAIKRWLVDPLVTVFGRIADLFEDVYGAPERQGVEARSGLMQRVSDLERRAWAPRHDGS